jgi:hypothetical protein
VFLFAEQLAGATMNQRGSTTVDEANPIKTDPQLQVLVKKLDKVKKYNTFQRWKSSFLTRFDEFLYEKGTEPAEKASSELDVNLKRLVGETTKVLDFIHKGDLGEDKKTVKAALALNEMCTSLEKVRGEIETLIPSLRSEEKRKGYTKFHLGAALIRQSFHQYVSMKVIEDAVTEIGEKLENVADRQQLDLFWYYKTHFKRFCDILADMGLYVVMLKCIEFSKPPDEEESEDPECLLILVESTTGGKLPMEVEVRDTISSIKDAISAGLDIPVPRQILKYNGNVIDDNSKTIEALKIKDGDVLTVEPMTIKITVKTPNGTQIQLTVDPEIKLSELQHQLAAESGIAANNQNISKRGTDFNEPNATIEECGIADGAVLDLEPKVISVDVMLPSKETLRIELSPKDDISAVKAIIASKSGLEARRQVLKHGEQPLADESVTVRDLGLTDSSSIDVDILKVPITVNIPDGKWIEMMVDPTICLSDLKRDLEAETGIAAQNQLLTKKGNELQDPSKTLYDFDIEAGTILDLEPKFINVHVTMPDGSAIEVEISPNDSASVIKEKIAAKTGMPVPRQVLSFNGSGFPDDVKARDVGLRQGSLIEVGIFKIPVNVNTWDDKVIKIMAEPMDKLLDFKTLLESASGLPAKNQIISMGDAVLRDDNKRVSAYGIIEGSTLFLEPRYMAVTVEMPDGTLCLFEVSAQSTGDEIKQKVEDHAGIVASRQVLQFNGKEMLADSTVKGMGIKGGDVIQCSLFKIPITVKAKDGTTFQLQIEPIEKIDDIKAMLEPLTGLAPRKQVLSFYEKELSVGTSAVSAYGIKKDSILELEPKDDPIVFVDVKYGTLFGVDRDEVIELGILNPDQGNPLEFKEAEKSTFGKERLCKAMLDSPNLGVKPQIVVEKVEIKDYDLKEAEQVKSKWGVQLKKTEKNKRGDELIYVDLRTGGFGLVDRKAATEKDFITVIVHGKDETLKQAEHNTRTYDKYVAGIRNIFAIKATK